MTTRVSDLECRGDLVARAQRGPLSAAERVALSAHLASCESCRVIQQVASDFAEVRAVDRGDAVRLEEMAAIARRTVRGGARSTRVGRRGYTRVAAAAAGLLLVAGSASATAWLWPRLVRPPAARIAPLTVPEPPAEPARRRTPSASASAESPPAPIVAAASERPARPLRERVFPRTSAAELLHQARDAKTDGRGERAIALYRRLQKEFPASSEALVGSVPLGRLLLASASPRAALAQFERYLTSVPRGALVPEALYGRAQAQQRLGERGAERASWQRLLSDYPDSPYSAPARRRLSELP